MNIHSYLGHLEQTNYSYYKSSNTRSYWRCSQDSSQIQMVRLNLFIIWENGNFQNIQRTIFTFLITTKNKKTQTKNIFYDVKIDIDN